jgi:hypothetical protein
MQNKQKQQLKFFMLEKIKSFKFERIINKNIKFNGINLFLGFPSINLTLTNDVIGNIQIISFLLNRAIPEKSG